MVEPIEVKAWGADWDGSIRVIVKSGRMFGKHITMETKEEGAYIEPTFVLKSQEAQQLLDSLLAAGVRPSSGEWSTGMLKATQDHLKDMRAIVWKEKEKP